MRILSITAILYSFIALSCNHNAASKSERNSLTLTAKWGGVNWNMPSFAQLADSLKDPTLYSISDSSYILHVCVTLTNPTNDTLMFSSWICSYEYSFHVDDSANFEVQSRYDCYLNGPCYISLPPHSSTDRFIMLRWKPSVKRSVIKGINGEEVIFSTPEFPSHSIRVGMDYEGSVLWSNELDPKQLYKNIYPAL